MPFVKVVVIKEVFSPQRKHPLSTADALTAAQPVG
jgi:hypothetical protein